MQSFHRAQRFKLRESRSTESVLEGFIERKISALVISTLPLKAKASKKLVQVGWAAETTEVATADHSTPVLGVLCKLSMEAFILRPSQMSIDSENHLRPAIFEEVFYFGVINLYGGELGLDIGK
jgi:hypothetical protein